MFSCLLTLIAGWSVWPDRGLLILGALVLRDNGAGNRETRDRIWVLKLESELLGVVVDVVDLVQD